MDFKSIPGAEVNEAVKSLNSILENGKVKTVGKTRDAVIQAFKSAVESMADDGLTDDIPEAAFEFYNKYIAAEEPAAEKTTDDDTQPAAKKTAGKKTTTTKRKPAADKKADVEEPAADEPAAKKTAAKKTAAKKPAAKKTADDDSDPTEKERKPRALKKDGVVALAVDAYMNHDQKTIKDIVEFLKDDFPGRNISATVSHVVCILNHVK